MEYHGMSTKKLTQQQKKLFLYKHNECQQTQNRAIHRDSLAGKQEMTQARNMLNSEEGCRWIETRE
jgi:hypothetical protein